MRSSTTTECSPPPACPPAHRPLVSSVECDFCLDFLVLFYLHLLLIYICIIFTVLLVFVLILPFVFLLSILFFLIVFILLPLSPLFTLPPSPYSSAFFSSSSLSLSSSSSSFLFLLFTLPPPPLSRCLHPLLSLLPLLTLPPPLLPLPRLSGRGPVGCTHQDSEALGGPGFSVLHQPPLRSSSDSPRLVQTSSDFCGTGW